MMRRIGLLVTTMGVLAGVFYAYYVATGGWEMPGRKRSANLPAMQFKPLTTRGTFDFADANELYVEDRDAQGRLKAVYRAKQWSRRAQGTYALSEPHVTLYQSGGQQTELRAEKGEIFAEQLAHGMDVRRAHLEGKVRVFFDPNGSEGHRAQKLDESRQDIVRIAMDYVDVDRERLTIHTESPVSVQSPWADIHGTGMTISWNETPRELRLLRIERGRRMVVYALPEGADILATPGAPAGGAPAKPNIADGAGAASGPAATTAAATAGTGTGKNGQIVEMGLSRLGEPKATRPTATMPKGVKHGQPVEIVPPRNQFRADFQGDVKVTRGVQRMHGADALTLRFEWSGDRGDRLSPLRGPTTRPAGAAAPATRAGLPPAAAPASRPATRPGGEPMEIVWSGPLVLQPTGYVDDPRTERYEVQARGKRVVLSDQQATAMCGEMVFRSPERTGRLTGSGERPARLLLSEGAEVTAPTIRFDPAGGRANLDGAGSMVRRFRTELPQSRALELIEQDPNGAIEGERITWSDHVDLAYSQQPTRDGKSRQFIDAADFFGGVDLQRPDTGDRMKCDQLAVKMARGSRGSAYPAVAAASGHVAARQEGSDIAADRMTVHFREVPAAAQIAGAGAAAAATTRPAPAAKQDATEPSSVLAEGNVRLTDKRDANADALEATCDKLTSDLLARKAVLTGSPAMIRQGPNKLVGKVIHVDERSQAASVDGNGTMAFLSRRDMAGRDLATARPIAIEWSRAMDFQGMANNGTFTGDVRLTSGTEEMACGKMQVMFSAVDANARPVKAKPATAPAEADSVLASGPAVGAGATAPAAPRAPRKARRGMGVQMERLSARQIAMVVADDQVLLRSGRLDEQGRILRRMQATGDKMTYDAARNIVTMPGKGTFLSEDYQAPKRRTASADPNNVVGAMDRPSQTAFQWHKTMQIWQNERQVIMDGNVVMVNRSGTEVALADELPVPRETWGTLKDGRKSILRCDSMLAQFGPPEDKPSTRPAEPESVLVRPVATRPAKRPSGDILSEGPALGPLDVFSAAGDVNLKDGPRQVLGQRIMYSREKDLAIVYGFKEGQEPANAVFVYEDPNSGRSQTWSSPKIIWQRQDNRIVTEEIKGSGGR